MGRIHGKSQHHEHQAGVLGRAHRKSGQSTPRASIMSPAGRRTRATKCKRSWLGNLAKQLHPSKKAALHVVKSGAPAHPTSTDQLRESQVSYAEPHLQLPKPTFGVGSLLFLCEASKSEATKIMVLAVRGTATHGRRMKPLQSFMSSYWGLNPQELAVHHAEHYQRHGRVGMRGRDILPRACRKYHG